MEASEARPCSALQTCAAALGCLCFGRAADVGRRARRGMQQQIAGGAGGAAKRLAAHLARAALALWCGGAAAGVLFGWQG